MPRARAALDHVSQLARVARPGIAFEERVDGVVQRLGLEIVAGAEFLEEILGQAADVLRALAQTRHADGDHGEPVIKILAELLLRDHFPQVAVGGRDHAHAHADGPLAADAVELALLEHPQELGLRGGMQVAHLVQEDGAAIGQLELAAAHADGARKRSLLVAEQLAFQ
jgi:hypothetical protein